MAKHLTNTAKAPRRIRFTAGHSLLLMPGSSGVVTDEEFSEMEGNACVAAWLEGGDLVARDTDDQAETVPDSDRAKVEGITTAQIAALLIQNDFGTLEKIAASDPETISGIKGIGEKTAAKLIEAATAATE